jgi:hypothetical protein
LLPERSIFLNEFKISSATKVPEKFSRDVFFLAASSLIVIKTLQRIGKSKAEISYFVDDHSSWSTCILRVLYQIPEKISVTL